jgi:hypothetical protein
MAFTPGSRIPHPVFIRVSSSYGRDFKRRRERGRREKRGEGRGERGEGGEGGVGRGG